MPGSPKESISSGVNMVGSPFTTGILDLGQIKPNTRNGKTYLSYNYANVTVLTANNWLYQEDTVTTDHKLPETAGSGSIQALENDGNLYYALGNGTYYIESPIDTKDQDGNSIPLAYRITGAKINAHYGTKSGALQEQYGDIWQQYLTQFGRNGLRQGQKGGLGKGSGTWSHCLLLCRDRKKPPFCWRIGKI